MLLTTNISSRDAFLLSSTSRGVQKKWVKSGYYYKADTFGYECISEALASQLCYNIAGFREGIEYTDYNLCNIRLDGEILCGCYSKNFLGDGESIVSFAKVIESVLTKEDCQRLFSNANRGKPLLEGVVSVCSMGTGVSEDDIKSYLARVLQLDAIILNPDRHLNNLAFIRSKSGTYRLAPIYDNGLAFLADTVTFGFERNVQQMVRSVKSKPFSNSFKKQVSYISGYGLLPISIKGLYKDLEDYSPPFKNKGYRRAYKVLELRLKELEGIAWRRV